jgi:hypothetical protein
MPILAIAGCADAARDRRIAGPMAPPIRAANWRRFMRQLPTIARAKAPCLSRGSITTAESSWISMSQLSSFDSVWKAFSRSKSAGAKARLLQAGQQLLARQHRLRLAPDLAVAPRRLERPQHQVEQPPSLASSRSGRSRAPAANWRQAAGSARRR